MLTKLICITTSMVICGAAFADCCTKEEKIPVNPSIEQAQELVQNDEERRINNDEQEEAVLADAGEDEEKKEKDVLPLANVDLEKKQEESQENLI